MTRQELDLKKFFQEKCQEEFEVVFSPPQPKEVIEYLGSSGILYRLNLPYAGRLQVKGETYSGGWAIGEQHGLYRLTFYVEADLPNPDEDVILQQEGPTTEEQEKISSYFDGTVTADDLVGSAPALFGARSPALQARAARFLRLLQDQALEAETTGRVRWEPTPYVNGPSHVNRARELRIQIARALQDSLPPDAYPVAAFYLERESSTDLQAEGARILSMIRGKNADDALVDLVEIPYNNSRVLLRALNAIKSRDLRVSRGALRTLATAHQPNVADAARALNAHLGYPALPAFDVMGYYRSSPVQRFLRSVDSLLIDPPPVNARLVRVDRRCVSGPDTTMQTYRGWLEWEARDSLRILTPSGWRYQFARHVEDRTREGGPLFKVSVYLVDWGLENEIRAMEQSDLGGDPIDRKDPTLHRITIARWLAGNGEDTLAAQATTSLIDAYSSTEEVLDHLRHVLGIRRGYMMFVAFVGDRDYAKALVEARLIGTRYRDSMFSKYAEQFLDEIPRRMDDFKTFRLPTPAEWREIQAALSRKEQIDFLCAHLRLVNGFQWGQPGGLAVSVGQTMEPQGLTADASWCLHRGKTPVINPYQELTGKSSGSDSLYGTPLGLGIPDIPQLVTHLEDDWFLLGVEFWRDFAAGRRMYRTSQLLAGLICGIAQERILDADDWPLLTEEQKDERIARVLRWVEENASRSEEERFIRQLAEAKRWYDVERLLPKLYEYERKDVVPQFLAFLNRAETNEYNRESIFSACRRLDGAQAVATAEAYLDDPSPGVRIQAGTILADYGDRAVGLEVIAEALAMGTNSTLSQSSALEGLRVLLQNGSKSWRRRAEIVLERDYFLDGWDHDQAALIKALVAAESSAPYKWLITSLADTTQRGSSGRQRLRRQDWIAQLAVRYLLPRDLGITYEFDDSEAARAGTRSRITTWLEDQIAAFPSDEE